MLHLSKKKIKKLFLKKNQTRKKKQYNNNNNIRNNNKKYKSLKNIKQQRHLNLRRKTLKKKRGGKKGSQQVQVNIDYINKYFEKIKYTDINTLISQLANDINVHGQINLDNETKPLNSYIRVFEKTNKSLATILSKITTLFTNKVLDTTKSGYNLLEDSFNNDILATEKLINDLIAVCKCR